MSSMAESPQCGSHGMRFLWPRLMSSQWRRFVRHLGQWCDDSSMQDLLNCVETGSYNYEAVQMLAAFLGNGWARDCSRPFQTDRPDITEPARPLYVGADPNIADPIMAKWTEMDRLMSDRLFYRCKQGPDNPLLDAYMLVRRDMQRLLIRSNDADSFEA